MPWSALSTCACESSTLHLEARRSLVGRRFRVPFNDPFLGRRGGAIMAGFLPILGPEADA